MRKLLAIPILALLPWTVRADAGEFATGPVFDDFGAVAEVEITYPIPEDAAFRHSFDVADRAADGTPNSTLVSAARFINMHARAGVDPSRIEIAVVVHGSAVHDVAGDDPGSAELVRALIGQGVTIIVCGQSAAYRGIENTDLLPGVRMALSAMTAHATLQQQGYTLNPF